MNRMLLAAVLALSLTIVASPSAMADDVAGASGQCFDNDGSGGEAYLAVTGDGPEQSGLADTENPDNNPPEGGAVDALVALTDGNGDPAAGNGCTSDDADQKDYIEVHAAGAQACYDGDVKTSGPSEDDVCPTRP